jgi:hypothetical protein
MSIRRGQLEWSKGRISPLGEDVFQGTQRVPDPMLTHRNRRSDLDQFYQRLQTGARLWGGATTTTAEPGVVACTKQQRVATLRHLLGANWSDLACLTCLPANQSFMQFDQ